MNGFSIARDITRKHARTFYFSSLFLRGKKRAAAYAVYAVCRISDESVDDSAAGAARANLEAVRGKIASAFAETPLADPLLSAFRETVRRYQIPKAHFDALVDGMRMDLEVTRYNDFEELNDYCYKVAGVVGLIMLGIFGSDHPGAPACAVSLGTAMQLTNILRDIGEDFERGRIYLPQDEMRRFGVGERDIAAGVIDEKFRSLMRFQISRAREYYRKAAGGIPMIADRNSRFVAAAMADLYAGILTAIERNGYDVFTRRACIRAPEKLAAILGIALRRPPRFY